MLEFSSVLLEHGTSSIEAVPASSQAFMYIPVQVASYKVKSTFMQV